jgi:hypothetical protein
MVVSQEKCHVCGKLRIVQGAGTLTLQLAAVVDQCR